MLTVCQAQFYVLHVGELISPYDSPIRVDTVVILTLERKKLKHREVDPGIFTLELTLLIWPFRGIVVPHCLDEETDEPEVTQWTNRI